MQPSDFFTSACRHCRQYTPQGRRGGHCTQLDVPVQGGWKACSLATPVFEPAWEFDGLPMWQQKRLEVLPSPLTVTSQEFPQELEVAVSHSS